MRRTRSRCERANRARTALIQRLGALTLGAALSLLACAGDAPAADSGDTLGSGVDKSALDGAADGADTSPLTPTTCLPATLPGGWTVHAVRTEPPEVPVYPTGGVSHADGDWTVAGRTSGALALDAEAANGLRWSAAEAGGVGVAERLTPEGALAWVGWLERAPFLYLGGAHADGGVTLWGERAGLGPSSLVVAGRAAVGLPFAGTAQPQPSQTGDLVVARLAADGAVRWAHAFGIADGPSNAHTGALRASSMTVLPDEGSVIVGTGGRGTLMTSASGAPLADWSANPVDGAGVVMRLDADGQLTWVRTVTGGLTTSPRTSRATAHGDGGVALVVVPLASAQRSGADLSLRVSGELVVVPGLDTQRFAAVLLVFDAAGTLTVSALLGATTGELLSVDGIAALAGGDLLVHGSMTDATTFGSGAAAVTLERDGSGAVQPFLARYDGVGQLRWARTVGRFDGIAMIGGRLGPVLANDERAFALVADHTVDVGASSFPTTGEALSDVLVTLDAAGGVVAAARLEGAATNFGWGAFLSAGPAGRLRVVTAFGGPVAFVTSEGRLDLFPGPTPDPFDPTTPRTLFLELERADGAPSPAGCSDWQPNP